MDIFTIPVSGPLGTCNCYLLRTKRGTILVDGGAPGDPKQFDRGLARSGVDPRSIFAVVLTHGHLDHIGTLTHIHSRLPQAKVIAHAHDACWIESGEPPYPAGVTAYGRAMVWAANRLAKMNLPGVTVDVKIESEMSLAEFGMDARIVMMPGHTAGSIAVLTNDGAVFVGDSAMNAWYLRMTPGLPILADDYPAVLNSWRLMLKRSIRVVYPAHGKPFSSDVIAAQLRAEGVA